MKRIITLFFFTVVSISTFAQAPQSISYQAVMRGSTGYYLTNENVNIRISIKQDSIGGAISYSETHNTTTNSYGIVNLSIGQGTVVSGVFSEIPWANSDHFIKIEVDTTDGTNYYNLGTTQLLSVPYALESKHSNSLTLTGQDGVDYFIRLNFAGDVIASKYNLEPAAPCPGLDTVIYEGQTYNTVLIGDQCWMKENLNVGVLINTSVGQSENGIIEKYCYDNVSDSCNSLGGLYTWSEAMNYSTTSGSQGICPPGWHLPTNEDWTELKTFLGGDTLVGGKMKEAGYYHWLPPNTGANNVSGFMALPAGNYALINDHFINYAFQCLFWSSSEGNYYSLRYDKQWLNYSQPSQPDNFGVSVRCLKDD